MHMRLVVPLVSLSLAATACGSAQCPRTADPPRAAPTPARREVTSAALVDPTRLIWDIAVVSPDGRRETFPLSNDSARLPIGLPCGIGPVQQTDSTPSSFRAIRALNCVHDGVTFSPLAECAIEDGRLRSAQAFMTVRDAQDRQTILSLACRAQ